MVDQSTIELGRLKSFKVILKNADGSRQYNITNLIRAFDFVEDIFKNTMYGSMRIKDAVDLLNGSVPLAVPGPYGREGFPITGEEFVELTYEPEYVYNTTNIKKNLRFAVYSVTDIIYHNNNTMKEYTLNFCSEEHLIDATSVIMKAYSKQNSDNVKDLCRDYLNLDDGSSSISTVGTSSNSVSSNSAPVAMVPFTTKKKLVTVQPTKGPQKSVIPKLSPLQTAEFFARRSIAEDDQFQSASYLFFENVDGYNFCDVEYLIKTGIDRVTSDNSKYIYYYENTMINISNDNDVQRQFKTIMSMQHKHHFDTIEKLKLGMFESDITVYDFINSGSITNRFRFTNNDQKDNNNSWTTGNHIPGAGDNLAYPENSTTFLNKVISPDDTSSKYSRKFLIPKDLSDPSTDSYLDIIYPNRASYFARLAQNMWTIKTYGDINIKAGDVIVLNVPLGNGANPTKNTNNPWISGYFLVGTIKHSFTQTTYLTTLDIYKNSFSAPVFFTDDSKKNYIENKAPHPVTMRSHKLPTSNTAPADPTDPNQTPSAATPPALTK